MKKVALVGPESTGKTTLARELAAHFETVWVPEAARLYAEEKKVPLTADDVLPIAQRHERDADAALSQAKQLLVLDTDLVMTCLYSEWYYGKCPLKLELRAQARLADLYLLLAPDVPWVPDPVRDMPDRREEIYQRIESKLRGWSANYRKITGDWTARRRQALAFVETELG